MELNWENPALDPLAVIHRNTRLKMIERDRKNGLYFLRENITESKTYLKYFLTQTLSNSFPTDLAFLDGNSIILITC